MGLFGDRDQTEDGLFNVFLASVLLLVSSTIGLVLPLLAGEPVGTPMSALPDLGFAGFVLGATGLLAGWVVGLVLLAAWLSFVWDRKRFGDRHRRHVLLGNVLIVASIVLSAVGMVVVGQQRIASLPGSGTTGADASVLTLSAVATLAGLLVAWSGFVAMLWSFLDDRGRKLAGVFVLLSAVGVAAGMSAVATVLGAADPSLALVGPHLGAATLAEVGAMAVLAVASGRAWRRFQTRREPVDAARSAGPAGSVTLPCPECGHRTTVEPARVGDALTCPSCGFEGRPPESLRSG